MCFNFDQLKHSDEKIKLFLFILWLESDVRIAVFQQKKDTQQSYYPESQGSVVVRVLDPLPKASGFNTHSKQST